MLLIVISHPPISGESSVFLHDYDYDYEQDYDQEAVLQIDTFIDSGLHQIADAPSPESSKRAICDAILRNDSSTECM